MRIVEVIANNKNASDDILAEVAKQAVESKDEQLLKKLVRHRRAGMETLSIIEDAKVFEKNLLFWFTGR